MRDAAQIPRMATPSVEHPERRYIIERRVLPDRRSGLDRRIGPRRVHTQPVETERRVRADQRDGGERRSAVSRRRWTDRRGSNIVWVDPLF